MTGLSCCKDLSKLLRFLWNDKLCFRIKKPPKNRRLYLKLLIIISNFSLFISQCSNPNSEGNHEHVSASFHLKNHLQLCDRKSET